MNYSSKILSQTLVQLCLAKGVRHIVISPGSRNAPLTIGFTAIDEFHCYSIVDERCAAFFALGLSQQLHQPVGLVCTSGSALLNYFPAIAEAYYSHIPLLVFSADRPSDLIDIGDGQTIRQEGVYGSHVVYAANLQEGTSYQITNENEISRALDSAIHQQGPVHINLPFSEPLYDRVTEPSVFPKPHLVETPQIWEEDLSLYQEKWRAATRKLVIIGALTPNAIEKELVEGMMADPSVLVLTETLSNVHHEKSIAAIDQLITALDSEGKKAIQPEILLSFGGMIVSKRIKALLRSYAPEEHWHVGEHRANDTFFVLNKHFKTNPTTFLKAFLTPEAKVPSTYQGYWLSIRDQRLNKHDAFIQRLPYSDFSVYYKLFTSIPESHQLQLANSAAVRYAQLFRSKPGWDVFCNRGTSGIDGSVSTAIGAAVGSKKPTVLVTGDLSFFYDSNALWNQYTPSNFRIVLINNGGGGIFRILPKAQEMPHFEKFFETQHDLNAGALAQMYQWEYECVDSQRDLDAALEKFFEPGTEPKLLEIKTPGSLNDKVLKDYFKALE